MNQLKRLLASKAFRLGLIIVIVGATLAAFTYYLITHPNIIGLILSLHPATLTLIAIGYVGTIVANAIVLGASLRVIGKRVPFADNVSLTGYSSVVNFFGPLQSGPGFRAAYLKTRHGVSLRKFFSLTVVFYGFFAAFNAVVIAVAALLRAPSGLALPLAIAGVLLVAVLVFIGYRFVPKIRTAIRSIKLSDPNVWLIGLGAVMLSLCTAFAYYFELFHVDPSVNMAQTLVYAAAANLALFVSLTPGAIGFRESFLLLTEQLHRIPDNVVIAASIIDRAFYIVFLLVMFAVLLGLGVRSRLTTKTVK